MPDTDRRQQILDGALRVFAKHGFHKASIKLIAREAGIKSSALIYHYFEDKKALLEAVIMERSPFQDLPLLQSETTRQMMDVPPADLLPQMAAQVLSVQDDPDLVRLLKLFLSEAARMPEVGVAVQNVQKRVLGLLETYLSHHIEAGNLRRHNVAASARILMGMFITHILANQVFMGVAEGMPDRDTYIQTLVTIYLEGLQV